MILLLSWFGIVYFLGGDIAGDLLPLLGIGSFLGGAYCRWFHISFFIGIRLSGLTPDHVPYKKETSVSADSYNWVIKFYVLVNLYIFIDSLVIFTFSEIGATKPSFYSSILSLGDSEFLLAF